MAASAQATATGPMRRLHRVVETRPGRAYARRVMRTRVSEHGWDPLPAAPVDLVARVAPLPLLLVHGLLLRSSQLLLLVLDAEECAWRRLQRRGGGVRDCRCSNVMLRYNVRNVQQAAVAV